MEAWNFCPRRGESGEACASQALNAGGFHCLFGEWLDTCAWKVTAPFGAGPVRIWDVSPTRNKVVYADPQRRVTVAERLKWNSRLILITVHHSPVRRHTFVKK